jgi:DNA-nicking Smr family endonuclease
MSTRGRNHRSYRNPPRADRPVDAPQEAPPEKQTPGDEVALFLAEVADATPLADRDRIPAPKPARRRRGEPAKLAEGAQALELEREGEHAWARAFGVSLSQLGELRAGRIEPEATLDLHGFGAAEAGDRADAFIAESVARGRRCVLVISGRGRKTHGVSVVKDEVLARLTRGRSARSIRAVSTAQARHGGPGALYVALKRA